MILSPWQPNECWKKCDISKCIKISDEKKAEQVTYQEQKAYVNAWYVLACTACYLYTLRPPASSWHSSVLCSSPLVACCFLLKKGFIQLRYCLIKLVALSPSVRSHWDKETHAIHKMHSQDNLLTMPRNGSKTDHAQKASLNRTHHFSGLNSKARRQEQAPPICLGSM